MCQRCIFVMYKSMGWIMNDTERKRGSRNEPGCHPARRSGCGRCRSRIPSSWPPPLWCYVISDQMRLSSSSTCMQAPRAERKLRQELEIKDNQEERRKGKRELRGRLVGRQANRLAGCLPKRAPELMRTSHVRLCVSDCVVRHAFMWVAGAAVSCQAASWCGTCCGS